MVKNSNKKIKSSLYFAKDFKYEKNPSWNLCNFSHTCDDCHFRFSIVPFKRHSRLSKMKKPTSPMTHVQKLITNYLRLRLKKSIYLTHPSANSLYPLIYNEYNGL